MLYLVTHRPISYHANIVIRARLATPVFCCFCVVLALNTYSNLKVFYCNIRFLLSVVFRFYII